MFGYSTSHSFEPVGLSTTDERAPLMSLDLSCFSSAGNMMFVRQNMSSTSQAVNKCTNLYTIWSRTEFSCCVNPTNVLEAQTGKTEKRKFWVFILVKHCMNLGRFRSYK